MQKVWKESKPGRQDHIRPNIGGGPSFVKRKMLCRMVQSIMFYDCTNIGQNTVHHKLVQLKKKVFLRAAHAFRLISAVALQFMIGTMLTL